MDLRLRGRTRSTPQGSDGYCGELTQLMPCMDGPGTHVPEFTVPMQCGR